MHYKKPVNQTTNGIGLSSLERELQRINQAPLSNIQAVNMLLEIAQVQSRVLNELAEMVLRLQHALDIVPEGLPMQSTQQTAGPQAL